MSELNTRLAEWINLQNLLTTEVGLIVNNLKTYDETIDLTAVKKGLYAIIVTGAVDIPNGMDIAKFKTISNEYDNNITKVLKALPVRMTNILGTELLTEFGLNDKSGEELLVILASKELYSYLTTE